MATSKEYKDFILEQLQAAGNITCRAMMGEYLLYCDGVLFGGIYDNRLLFKITDGNKKYCMTEQLPYDGSKPMYMPDDADDAELICRIVSDTCRTLPVKNKKSGK